MWSQVPFRFTSFVASIYSQSAESLTRTFLGSIVPFDHQEVNTGSVILEARRVGCWPWVVLLVCREPNFQCLLPGTISLGNLKEGPY